MAIIILDGNGRSGGASRRAGGRDERPPAIPSATGTSAVPPSSAAAGSASSQAQRRWVPPSSVHKHNSSPASTAGALPANAERHDAIFRKVRGILNKLTPEKFDKLSLELLNVGINSELVLRGIILLIFEKALDEAKYSSLYAQLCHRICEDAPNFEPSSSNITTFRRLLLNKCQDEFENRSRATEVFDKDGVLSPDEEEQLLVARRKMLGNIKFIGELGKLEMLHEGILHQCIKQLLAKKKQVAVADQAEDLECLCQIMRTVGKRLDHDKARLWMDQYFERIKSLAANNDLPSRIRFMLQDVIELRANNWRPRKVLSDVGPKTIQQVHAEAAKEYGMMPGNHTALSMNMGGMGGPMGLAMMGNMDLFGPPRPTMNGTSGQGQQPRGGMADVFGPMSPPFMGSSTGIGTGPGTIPMDSFQTTFFPGGGGNRARGGQQKQGYYGGRHQDGGSSSPKSNRQQSSQSGQQEGRSSSPRYGSDNRSGNRGNQQQQHSQSPPSQRSNRYDRSDRNNRDNWDTPSRESRDYSPNQENSPRSGYQQNRGGSSSGGSGGQSQYPNKPHFQQGRGQTSRETQQQQAQQHGGRELPPRFQRKLQQQQQQSSSGPDFGSQQPPSSSSSSSQLSTNTGSGSFTPPFSEIPRQGSPQPPFLGPSSNAPTSQSSPHVSPQKSGEAPLGADTTRDEISLRPARNLAPLLRPNTPSFLPRSAQTPPQHFQQSLRPRIMGPPGGDPGLDAPSLLAPKQPQVTIRQVPAHQEKEKNKNKEKEREKKGPSTEQLKEATDNMLKNYLNGGSAEDAVKAVREMKAPRKYLPQMVSQLLLQSLDRADTDRENVCKLMAALHKEGILSSELFIEGFTTILAQLSTLESDIPLVKSYIAKFAAQAVSLEVVSLVELAEPLEGGRHYPLFLLCLQQLHKARDRKWLVTAFNDSKIDLLTMLPESDRTKERMMEILEDRGLSFMFPLMRVQSDIMRQIRADPSPQNLYKWVKDNVDIDLQTSRGFIDILTTSLLKYILQETTFPEGTDPGAAPEKGVQEKEKEMVGRYKGMLQRFLQDSIQLQLTGLYSLQVLAHSLAFPKGLLLRMFMNLYDLEVIDEEAFLKWKEDINDEYPGKGKALFQVNQWLTWLEQAEEEESEDDD